MRSWGARDRQSRRGYELPDYHLLEGDAGPRVRHWRGVLRGVHGLNILEHIAHVPASTFLTGVGNRENSGATRYPSN